jgi:hypothetical protein
MTQQQQFDLIMIVLFTVCVVYVLNQAKNSLATQAKVDFDKKSLEQQLEDRKIKDVPLKELVEISFDMNDKKFKYSFSDKSADFPKELSITVKNKFNPATPNPSDLSHVMIHVDWDSSSFIDFGGASRRVMRMAPDMRLADVSTRQAHNIVPPGYSLSEKIVPEDFVEFDTDKSQLKSGKQLIDLFKLKEKAEDKKASDATKALFNDFKAGKETILLKLYLMLHFVVFIDGHKQENSFPLLCHFIVKDVPWTDYLPFKF